MSSFIVAIYRALWRTWWALTIVLVFWATAAKVFQAYIRFPWLDIPTHFAGGMAISFFFSASIEELDSVVGVTPAAVRRLFSVAMTAFAAVIWEFLEFESDSWLGSHLNLGVRDTLSDLFFGILGGITTTVLLWVIESRRPVITTASSA